MSTGERSLFPWQPEKDLTGHLQCDVKGTMRKSGASPRAGLGVQSELSGDRQSRRAALPLPHVLSETQRTGVGCTSPLLHSKA